MVTKNALWFEVTDDETLGVQCVQLSLCGKARENNSPLSVNSTERIWARNSLMGAPLHGQGGGAL
jgi:hypothetical protein